MKKCSKIIFCVVVIAFVSFGFTKIKMGAVMGKFAPNASITAVYLVKGTDTLAKNIGSQPFLFENLKEGVYAVFIKGNNNYRDSLIKNVAVKDSSTTDIGSIKLNL